MGRATTRSLERMAAAMGVVQGAPVDFELVNGVPCGGVLLALPALLQNGLLAHSRDLFWSSAATPSPSPSPTARRPWTPVASHVLLALCFGAWLERA